MRPVNVSAIKHAIYTMKRDYGQQATIYNILSSLTDEVTGVKSVTIETFNIPRAVVIPESLTKKFYYDIAYLAANKNFTYGGVLDIETKQLLIDHNDFNKSRLNLEAYISIKDQRYQIVSIVDLDHRLGAILRLKAVQGSNGGLVIDLRLSDTLYFYQGANYVS